MSKYKAVREAREFIRKAEQKPPKPPTAEEIVAALAACEEPIVEGYGTCALCGGGGWVDPVLGKRAAMHEPYQCPWLMARSYMESK